MQGRRPSQALLFPSSEGSVCPAVNLSLQFCSKAIRLMCIHQALISNAEEVKVSESCPTLCDPMDHTVHGIFQANTGVGSPSLLQGIFPTQGSNPGLQHCRRILYQLSHRGSPRILEWVAYPFSRQSSQLRNPTGVSCIAGGFFTN